MNPTITQALAGFLATTRAFSSSAVHAAKRAMLDALGCAGAGRRAPGVETVAQQVAEWGGKAEATIWWREARLPAPAAAFANSVTVHALDLDDVHVPSTTHLTSVVVPAAVAVGEAQNASGLAVLEAVITGVEAAARLGVPAKTCRTEHGYLPTTVFGVFGAAAATARLIGLDADRTGHALGLAYAHACGNRQALFDHTLAKRIQPAIAARSGVESAHLAARGVTGARRVVEGAAGLFRLYGSDPARTPDPENVAEDRDTWEIERLSFKSYACCGASHPLLLAAIDLAAQHGLRLADVIEAEIIGVDNPFIGVPWDPSRASQEQVQFCAPYQVVAAIKYGRFGAAEIDDARIRADREVSDAARRVKIVGGKVASGEQTLRLRIRDGRTLTQTRTREDVLAPHAMSDDALLAKFRQNTGDTRLADAIMTMDTTDLIADLVKEFLHESA